MKDQRAYQVWVQSLIPQLDRLPRRVPQVNS